MKKVNIVIGRFQPFTKGHKLILEQMYTQNKLPTVIFYIENTRKDKRHPFSDDITEEIINLSLKADTKLFAGCFKVRSANIVAIGDILYKNHLEGVLFGCGSDREGAYEKQVNNKKYREEGHFSDEFKLFPIKRNEESNSVDGISATKVRNAIKENDFDSFYNMMSIKDKQKARFLFNKMKDEIEQVKESKISLKDFVMTY